SSNGGFSRGTSLDAGKTQRRLGRTLSVGMRTQPFQGWKRKPPGPRVAAVGNPGLDDATPSGVNARCPNQVAAYQYTGLCSATLDWTTQPFQGWDATMPNTQGSR